jgi:hypothetical protein
MASGAKVENCADNEGVSVENDLHSVKDVPRIYFVVNVGIVSEKKYYALLPCRPSRIASHFRVEVTTMSETISEAVHSLHSLS